ncbi:hypothetical protein J4G33_06165 [Actinotalea sp. BY-33]|uniref:Uncharacterized protein n=1 Tax=Actinotalea soli TaxID=2819234 RepID=A0A939LSP1_9CELL|nr:hypothetical protein [Actinotalea soli]MBO1751384.1 hypothetical protein [Actinotalea soli]
MGLTLSLCGLVLLALTLWWRAAPAPGRTRWWTGMDLNERSVLLGLPGFALMLVAAGPMGTYEGEAWKLWFSLVFAVGGVMAMWAWLFLPLPRWLLPRWLRARRGG